MNVCLYKRVKVALSISNIAANLGVRQFDAPGAAPCVECFLRRVEVLRRLLSVEKSLQFSSPDFPALRELALRYGVISAADLQLKLLRLRFLFRQFFSGFANCCGSDRKMSCELAVYVTLARHTVG